MVGKTYSDPPYFVVTSEASEIVRYVRNIRVGGFIAILECKRLHRRLVARDAQRLEAPYGHLRGSKREPPKEEE